ncbi:MAG: DedA family protein [Acidobacteriota bacterium]|nr:DedA family protein [Acidobacteriota bacterium]
MSSLIERAIEVFSRIPAGWALAAVFLFPALETGLVLGFIVPGETAVVLGGVLASTGRVPLWAAAAASVAGAIAGDCAGYVIGRRYGEKAIRRRLGKKWNRAHSWLSKNGVLPIFLARFVPFVRTVLPVTAGAIEVPRRRFFPPDIAAGIVWGVGSTLLGYWAGRDLEKALAVGNRVAIGFGIALAAAVGFWAWRRKKPTGRARAKS